MATGESTYLSHNDAIMWNVEADPLLRSTIVVVFLLDRLPDWQRLAARVRRAIDRVPALRQRVARVPLHPGALEWVDADEIDLRYHLRRERLATDGGSDQLLAFARVTSAGGFDLARPLWRFTLVDGVDVEGGRAAFVITAHHVVADGIGAVSLATHLFDLVPDGDLDVISGSGLEPPLGEWNPPHGTHADRAPAGAIGRWWHAIVHDAETVAALAGSQLHEAVPSLLHGLRHPATAVTDTLATAASVGRAVAPAVDAKSPLMTGRTMTHRFDDINVPMDLLGAAGRRAGGTLNDAFLAGITGGMRRYHEHHGVDVAELRMAMPISLRTDEHDAGGNHVTVLRTNVPIDAVDPRDRILAMHEVVRRLRSERSLAHTEAIAGVLNLLPTGVVGTMLKRVDFLASNVPGVPVPLHLAGSEVMRIVPFGPTAGTSVNLTLMSYRGGCGIGIHTDAGAIPDPEVFVGCIADSFAEVVALATD